MPEADHESTCKRCGSCCRRKIALEGVVVYTPFWCRFLDRATKLCTVYGERHKASPNCLDIESAKRQHALPSSCAYVQGLAGYRGPVEGFRWWDMPEEIQRDLAARIGVTAREFEAARAEHYAKVPAPAPAGA